jgi:cytochrome P450
MEDIRALPGPRNRFPGDLLLQFMKDPLAFLEDANARFGSRTVFSFVSAPLVLLSNPDDLHEVLVTKDSAFCRVDSAFLEESLGPSLMTGEGSVHNRRRRLMLPAFHSARLSSYANIVVTATEVWAKHQASRFQLEIQSAMVNLTSQVVGKALFNVEIDDLIPSALERLNEIEGMSPRFSLPLGPYFMKLPLPSHHRYRRAKVELDRIMGEILRRHSSSKEDRGDIVSMLIQARDEAGQGLSNAELRNEMKAMFMAGHEPSASALAFAWVLLAQHPSEEHALADELNTVLAGRVPTFADFPRLRYARAVFAEILRLYPPIWFMARAALEDVVIGTLRIPKGTVIFMSPWVTHRDPKCFEEPLRFRPSRWLENPELAASRAYFPFSKGARSCIGEGLAWLEGTLILACLVPRFKFQLPEGFHLDIDKRFTLRLGRPVMMTGHAK